MYYNLDLIFQIAKYCFYLFNIVTFFGGIYLIIINVFPIIVKLGKSIANRKVAVFAHNEYSSLNTLLIDSNIFKKKNIIQVHVNDLRKAEGLDLFLVHWSYCIGHIDEILSIKNDQTALIIYAPIDEGRIEENILKKINSHRNCIIVNFRGRLLNDVFTVLMTTGYRK